MNFNKLKQQIKRDKISYSKFIDYLNKNKITYKSEWNMDGGTRKVYVDRNMIFNFNDMPLDDGEFLF